MPVDIMSHINKAFREHARYTGDGLAGEPASAPLPLGDVSSPKALISKAEVRGSFTAVEKAINEGLDGLDEQVQSAADSATEAAASAAAAAAAAATAEAIAGFDGSASTVVFDDTDVGLGAANAQEAIEILAARPISQDLTPEEFGCAGDGTTDDGPNFAAALAAAQAQGRVLSLRSGSAYLLATWTPVTQTAELIIRGNGAVIRGSSTDSVSDRVFLRPTARFEIEGVEFDRWNFILDRRIADSGDITGAKFIHNKASNITNIPVNIEVPFKDSLIAWNRFTNCSGGIVIRIGTNEYAAQDTWTGNRVIGNVLRTISASGTQSLFAILLYGARSLIAFNDVEGCASQNGESVGIYTKLRDSRIIGNNVRNCNSSGTSGEALDVGGINIKGAPVSMTTSGPQGFNCIVANNVVQRIGVANVKGYGIRLQVADSQAVNNIVEDFGLNGIANDDSNSTSNNRIEGNNIRDRTFGATSANGITIETTGTRHSVKNNVIAVFGTGVRVLPFTGGIRAVHIIGNLIRAGSGSVGNGIRLGPVAQISFILIAQNSFEMTAGVSVIAYENTPFKAIHMQNDYVDCSIPLVSGTPPSVGNFINADNMA